MAAPLSMSPAASFTPLGHGLGLAVEIQGGPGIEQHGIALVPLLCPFRMAWVIAAFSAGVAAHEIGLFAAGKAEVLRL